MAKAAMWTGDFQMAFGQVAAYPDQNLDRCRNTEHFFCIESFHRARAFRRTQGTATHTHGL